MALDQLFALVQPLGCLIPEEEKNVKNILIMSFSVIRSDPRVMRQVRLLERNYRVTVSGFGPRPDADIEFIEIAKPRVSIFQKAIWGIKLLSRLFESYYWSLPQVRNGFKAIRSRSFDLLIANDIAALPLALRLAGKAPVLVDAHEYSPREFDDKWLWRLLFAPYHEALCSRYLPQAAAMTTVCRGIADEYAKEYGITASVVFNAPLEQGLEPSPGRPGRIRLIHHGSAIRSRHLGVMVEMMRYLGEEFMLDFMLVETDPVYMAELRETAREDQRVRFVEPVAMPEICRQLNQYDVGIYLLPPVNFNHEHALPNKFFEFIQARLAVAIGPSTEMARIVNEYSLGVIADSFEPKALAAVLDQLTDESICGYKQAADNAARELNYEAAGQVLLHEIERLV
jgi:hypothetical protein